MTGPFIEQCFCLTPKRAERSLNRFRKIGDKSDYGRTDITYEYQEENDKLFLLVTIGSNPAQKIAIEGIESAFWGIKEYFFCSDCGNRVLKLYLLPEGQKFKCRNCHKLKYSRQSINPSSRHGKIFLQTDRMLKLMAEREKIRRPFYDSKYTRRYNRWLDNAFKAGLVEMVTEARMLESMVAKVEKV